MRESKETRLLTPGTTWQALIASVLPIPTPITRRHITEIRCRHRRIGRWRGAFVAAVHQQGVVRVPLPFPGGGGGVAHRRRMPNQCSLPRRDAMRRGGNPRKSICARGRRGVFFFVATTKPSKRFAAERNVTLWEGFFTSPITSPVGLSRTRPHRKPFGATPVKKRD
ncbi:hypothetical protein M433DRAFT_193767 [Acidomyces richmondensis BFW]|nr:hypothetical protein M433DRAFT_193767 [Acidomyces richmondensis BFW]